MLIFIIQFLPFFLSFIPSHYSDRNLSVSLHDRLWAVQAEKLELFLSFISNTKNTFLENSDSPTSKNISQI